MKNKTYANYADALIAKLEFCSLNYFDPHDWKVVKIENRFSFEKVEDRNYSY